MTRDFARRAARRLAPALLVLVLSVVAGSLAAAQTPPPAEPPRPVADPTQPTTHPTPPPAQVDGFVPASSLPPGDQVAPGPLVLAAYGLAWVAILFYVWTLWTRLTRVETEIADLARRVDTSLRPGGARPRS